MIENLKKELEAKANPEKAKILSRFFKTGKGEYGHGDVFLGISVPMQRAAAKRYHSIPLKETEKLLSSNIHEHRLTALAILVNRFRKSGPERKEIYRLYLRNTKRINNWDLVDISAPNIVGEYLIENPAERKVLYRLAESKNLWEKRISILSCLAFIRKNDFDDVLKICEILINDSHDLIHKASGWMLREIGKRSLETLYEFLDKHYKQMPRTMLRYAIEKLSDEKKAFYMNR